jgi:DnaJ-class molecular chaperone
VTLLAASPSPLTHPPSPPTRAPPSQLSNQYGEDALKEGAGAAAGPAGGMANLFGQIFGGGRGGGAARPRRSEDVVHKLPVSLEELYSGTTK